MVSLEDLSNEYTVVGNFCKQADFSSRKPATAYADTYNKEYPIDTPANAVVSKAYAIKTGEVAAHVVSRIDRALDIYNVPTPRPKMLKEAQVEEDVVYLLPEYHKYPIKTAADIPEADKALNRISRKLGTKSLARASSILVKVAAANGQEVSENVMRWAGLKMCDVEKTAAWIEARGDVSRNKVFLKLADRVRGIEGPKTRSDLVKLAEAVETLDSRYELDRFYGSKLPNPLDTVFSSKEAMSDVLDLGTKEVSVDKLLSLPVTFYEDVLGEDIAEEISSGGDVDKEKLLTILPTLPKDMKQLLCSKIYSK